VYFFLSDATIISRIEDVYKSTSALHAGVTGDSCQFANVSTVNRMAVWRTIHC